MSDVKSCFYTISIGGKPLDKDMMNYIDEVSYEDNASESDLLTIAINDPDFIFIEDSLFLEDKEVTFTGGWLGEQPVTFEGFISVIDISFPESGCPVLVLHCMDSTHSMNKSAKKKTWNKKKMSDVAREIFNRYGLKCVIDDTKDVLDTISQSQTSDIQFLIAQAKKEKVPYLVYVKDGVGYYVKKQLLTQPSKELVYRQTPYNLLSFEPRINKENKKEGVEKSDVNDKDKSVDKAVANDSTNREVQGNKVSTKPTQAYTQKTFNGNEWVNTSNSGKNEIIKQ